MQRSSPFEQQLSDLYRSKDARMSCKLLTALKQDPACLASATERQLGDLLDFIIQQLPQCVAPSAAADSSNNSNDDLADRKQLCKHLLHTVTVIKQQQLHSALSAASIQANNPPQPKQAQDNSNGTKVDSSSSSRAARLLEALQPHLLLPHPFNSLTTSMLAYQCLERVLNWYGEQQQQQQQQRQKQKQQQEETIAADAGHLQQPGESDKVPDSQVSKDTQEAAAHGAPQQQEQQQLLLSSFKSAWYARLYTPNDLQDNPAANYALQMHAAAHNCLLLLHQLLPKRYSSTNASGHAKPSKVQQLLMDMIIGAANGTSSDTNQQQQQQQQGPPLLTAVKQLILTYKMATKLYGDPGSSSKRRSSDASSITPTDAAAAAAANGPTAAAAVVQVACELTGSGIDAWGLLAGQLGQMFLHRSVGQPMLTMLQWVFTCRNSALRHRALHSWCGFICCCQQVQQIYRKQVVLLQPILFALQQDSNQQVRTAALCSWSCMVQAAMNQQPLFDGDHGDVQLGLRFGATAAAAAGGGACSTMLPPQQLQLISQFEVAGDFAGWLQALIRKSPAAAVEHQEQQQRWQQQQPCEMSLYADAFEILVKPIAEQILNPTTASSSGGKSPRVVNCLAGIPILQFVLQQILIHTAAAAVAAAAASVSAVEPSSRSSAQENADSQAKPEPGPAAAAAAAKLIIKVCKLISSSVCGSRTAAAVLAAATDEYSAAAAAAVGKENNVPGDVHELAAQSAVCKTPATANAQQQQQRQGVVSSASFRLSTPPTSPRNGAAAAAAGLTTPVTPVDSAAKLATAHTLALQSNATPAAAAAAGPAWVLHSAAGWLQLLAMSYQLLLPLLPGTDPLWQQWLQAWQQLLLLIGAAAKQQQQQQQQHQGSPGARDVSSNGPAVQQQQQENGAVTRWHQQQQQSVINAAVQAAVQAMHSMHLITAEQQKRNANSSSSSTSRIYGLIVQAAAAVIGELPAASLATAFPASPSLLPLPVDLAAAARTAAGRQQQQQVNQQSAKQSALSGKYCWQVLVKMLLYCYADLAAADSVTMHVSAAAGSSPLPPPPTAAAAAVVEPVINNNAAQIEEQIVTCLTRCCEVAQGPGTSAVALKLLDHLVTDWPDQPAAAAAADQEHHKALVAAAAAHKLTAWCILVSKLLLTPDASSRVTDNADQAAGCIYRCDSSMLAAATVTAAGSDAFDRFYEQVAGVLLMPLTALRRCCQRITCSSSGSEAIGSSTPQQQHQQQQQQQQRQVGGLLQVVQQTVHCWCNTLQNLIQALTDSVSSCSISKPAAAQTLLLLHMLPAAATATFDGKAAVAACEGDFVWLQAVAADSSSSGANAMQMQVVAVVGQLCIGLQQLVSTAAELSSQQHSITAAAAGNGGSSRPLFATGTSSTPTKFRLRLKGSTAAAAATPGSTAAAAPGSTAAAAPGSSSVLGSITAEHAAAKAAGKIALQQQQVQSMAVACVQLAMGLITAVRTTAAVMQEAQQQQYDGASVIQELVSVPIRCLCCMPDAAVAADILDQHVVPMMLLLLDRLSSSSSSSSSNTAAAVVVSVLMRVVPVLLEWLATLQASAATTKLSSDRPVSEVVQRCINSLSPLITLVFSKPAQPAAAAAADELQSTTYQLLNKLLEGGSYDNDTQLLVLPVQLQEVLHEFAPSAIITGSLAPDAGCITPRKAVSSTAAAPAKTPTAAAAAMTPTRVLNGNVSPAPSFIPATNQSTAAAAAGSSGEKRSSSSSGGKPTTDEEADTTAAGSSRSKQRTAGPSKDALPSKRRRTVPKWLEETQTDYVLIPYNQQQQPQFVGRKRRASVNTYTALDGSQQVVAGGSLEPGSEGLLPAAAAAVEEHEPSAKMQRLHAGDEVQQQQQQQMEDSDMVAATQDEDMPQAAAVVSAAQDLAATAVAYAASGTAVSELPSILAENAQQQQQQQYMPVGDNAFVGNSSAPAIASAAAAGGGGGGGGDNSAAVVQTEVLQQQSMPASVIPLVTGAGLTAVAPLQQSIGTTAVTAVPTQVLQQQSLPATVPTAAAAVCQADNPARTLPQQGWQQQQQVHEQILSTVPVNAVLQQQQQQQQAQQAMAVPPAATIVADSAATASAAAAAHVTQIPQQQQQQCIAGSVSTVNMPTQQLLAASEAQQQCQQQQQQQQVHSQILSTVPVNASVMQQQQQQAQPPVQHPPPPATAAAATTLASSAAASTNADLAPPTSVPAPTTAAAPTLSPVGEAVAATAVTAGNAITAAVLHDQSTAAATAAAADAVDDMDALEIDPSQQWMPGQHKVQVTCRPLYKQQLQQQQQQQQQRSGTMTPAASGGFGPPNALVQHNNSANAAAAVGPAGAGVVQPNHLAFLLGVPVAAAAGGGGATPTAAAGAITAVLVHSPQKQQQQLPSTSAAPGEALLSKLAFMRQVAAATAGSGSGGNSSNASAMHQWLKGLSGAELSDLQSALMAAHRNVADEVDRRLRS